MNDPMRQARYILIESKKGSKDIRANLLKLGPEINEGRKSKIFFYEKGTGHRVYVWEENPYFKLNSETKKGMILLLNNNAVELGDILERIRRESCGVIAVTKKKGKKT